MSESDDTADLDDLGATPASLRLTFRVVEGEVELLRSERVDAICPPAPGEPPQAGEHGGFWMELRDDRDRVLAHRVLADPLVQSVEVFSPAGTIRREFGTVPEAVFEVMLPAEPEATSVALVGEPGEPGAAAVEGEVVTRELVRFELPDQRGEGE
jgi:hypothetical protein